jgi:hypothetical protein
MVLLSYRQPLINLRCCSLVFFVDLLLSWIDCFNRLIPLHFMKKINVMQTSSIPQCEKISLDSDCLAIK